MVKKKTDWLETKDKENMEKFKEGKLHSRKLTPDQRNDLNNEYGSVW